MLFSSRGRTARIAGAHLAGRARRLLEKKVSVQLLSVLSLGCLLSVLAGYLAVWIPGNWEMLTDPRLQNSDARTSIFPFHRYAADPALEGDPIADEMLALVPIGVRLLYRVLVPFSDVFVAPKLVQAIALGVLLWAAVILARSKRAGIAAAAVLLFLVLHDWFAIYRVAGGLPRAFGFPLFALWLAGIAAGRPWVRFAAPVLCALTYPSVMNMILAGEGLYALRGLPRPPLSLTLRRLKRYALLVTTCLVCVLPAVVGGDERGPIHSLEEAQKDPAFGKDGRLWILPFADPTDALGDAFVDQLKPRGKPLVASLGQAYAQDPEMFALVLLCLVLGLWLVGISPSPVLPASFLAGTIILYALSRSFAFHLYSPERYYSFGMRMAAIGLLFLVVSRSFAGWRSPYRVVLQNLLAAGFVLLIWSLTGSGVVRLNGMTIDQRRDQSLYQFIHSLPKDVRFATHPMDGDGIPYYSARATMGSFETLQPWFVGSWSKQVERTKATLQALYAEDGTRVREYAQKYGVTHFLINGRRYRRDFRRHAKSFEPFSSYARDLLAGKREKQLYFDRVPEAAIIYEQGPWKVVAVSQL